MSKSARTKALELVSSPLDSLPEPVDYPKNSQEKLDELYSLFGLPAYQKGASAEESLDAALKCDQRGTLSQIQAGQHYSDAVAQAGWGGLTELAQTKGVSKQYIIRRVDAHKTFLRLPVSFSPCAEQMSITQIAALKNITDESWALLDAGEPLAGKTLEELPTTPARDLESWVRRQEDPLLKRVTDDLEREREKTAKLKAELEAKHEDYENLASKKYPPIVAETREEAYALTDHISAQVGLLRQFITAVKYSYNISSPDKYEELQSLNPEGADHLRAALGPVALNLRASLAAISELTHYCHETFGNAFPVDDQELLAVFISKIESKHALERREAVIRSALKNDEYREATRKKDGRPGKHPHTKAMLRRDQLHAEKLNKL